MPVIARPIKNLVLPEEHLRIRKIRALQTFLLACRGSFKTSRALALFVIDMVHAMPRSSGMICGISYEDMGNNTINPFLGGLAQLGYLEGEHYVIGRKPPEHWDTPYLGVINKKYDRVMTWYNGTTVHLVSMEKKAPANGLSVQWGFFDEVKFMDESKLIDKIFPTFRGNEDILSADGIPWKDCSFYLSKFFATDKEADPAQIKWLLDKRKVSIDKELQDIIISHQEYIEELYSYFHHPESSKTFKGELLKEINLVRAELHEMRKGSTYVSEISIEDIKAYVSPAWYDDKKRNSTKRKWDVVYLNKDPETPGDTFYPNFDKSIHTYRTFLQDIDTNKPFILALDYQHSVAPITIAQLSKLSWRDDVTLNYVDEVYTLPDPNEKDIQPNGNGSQGSIDEAVQLFKDMYKDHKCKTVYFIYDHTAKGRRIKADKYYVMVEKKLKEAPDRWRVVKVYTGKAPDHWTKYSNTCDLFKHADPSVPKILINANRCPKTIISISNSAAVTRAGKTEKEKKYEDTTRYPGYDQSETTHFSDCFDMSNHGVLVLKKVKIGKSMKVSGTR